MGILVLCILAGIGLMSILWVFLGVFLPAAEGMILLCGEIPGDLSLMRCRWLRDMGLLNCPVVVLKEEMPAVIPKDIEICSREMLISRLEQEWNNCHGTGTGDPSGHHWCSGISEL